MSACHHLDEVILHAFHQLSPAEEAALKEHLSICSACRMKLNEIMETVDHLGLTAEPITPPDDLRGKVIERVKLQARFTGPKRPRLASAWVAVAAAVAIALGSYAVLRVEGLQERIAGLLESKPAEQSATLEGVESAASARATFAPEGGGVRITLEAQGLTPLPAGEVYQLWLVKDGIRTSGGVFVVDAAGKGGMSTWLSGEATFDALGVTREPDAFGDQPRGPKVLGTAT